VGKQESAYRVEPRVTPAQAAKKRYREANRDKVREAERLRQSAKRGRDPVYQLYYGAKSRANKSELEFDIELSDITIPERCPILDVLLFGNHLGKRPNINSPSLDRVDNDKGYVKGNVRVISYVANRYKSNLSKDSIDRLYRYVNGEL
jgi:hypothetical protein